MVVCRPTTAGNASRTPGGRLLSPPGRLASTPPSPLMWWLEPFADPFNPRAIFTSAFILKDRRPRLRLLYDDDGAPRRPVRNHRRACPGARCKPGRTGHG